MCANLHVRKSAFHNHYKIALFLQFKFLFASLSAIVLNYNIDDHGVRAPTIQFWQPILFKCITRMKLLRVLVLKLLPQVLI